MITFRQKGDFSKATRYFEKLRDGIRTEILDRYGREGVAALASATPVDTGLTASSWTYTITKNRGSAAIEFHNTHVNKNVNIAIILQYGHGTRTGGYVQGRDYINPAIQPIFDRMADDVWKEVVKL